MAPATPVVPASPSVRQRVRESTARIARVKLIDRCATVVITAGGISITVAVFFIFLFILGETLPLFRSAHGQARGALTLAPTGPGVEARPLAVGTDDDQKYLYELLPDGRYVFFRLADGSLAREVPLASLGRATLLSASRSLTGDLVGAGTTEGRVALAQVRFRARFEGQKMVDLDLEVKERGLLEMDPARRPVREVSYGENEGRKAVAAVLGEAEVAVLRPDENGQEKRETLHTDGGERVTHIRLSKTEGLVASTDQGNLYYWELGSEFRRIEVKHVSAEPITALEYVIGGNSVLVGDAKGNLTAWFRVRLRDEDQDLSLVEAHTFPSQGVSIRAIGRSARDKSFVSAGAAGSLVLRHMTSERTLLTFPATGFSVDSVSISPKADAIIAQQADGRLLRFDISNPHPE